MQGLGGVVAGGGEQLLRLFDIVAIGNVAVIEVLHVRRDRTGRELRNASVNGFSQSVLVNGVVDCQTEVGIIEGRLGVVHAQINEGRAQVANHIGIRVVGQTRDIICGNFKDDIDGACLKLDDAAVRLDDRADDQIFVGRLLAPILFVADVDALVILIPGNELERAGANGMGLCVLDIRGEFLLGNDNSTDVRQIAEKREGILRGDDDRVIILNLAVLGINVAHDIRNLCAIGAGCAGEAIKDIARLHLFTVVELDALTEMESPGRLVNTLIALSQQRLKVAVLIVAVERFIDGVEVVDACGVRRSVRIEGRGIAVEGND